MSENNNCDSERSCNVTPSFSAPLPSSHCSILIKFSFITGSGTTVKSISFVMTQLVLIILVTVATTVCVFVLNGFGNWCEFWALPFSST